MVAHNSEIPEWRQRARLEGWEEWIRTPGDEAAAAEGFVFSQNAADIWVSFFENVLVHTRGEMAGKPFTLLDWQRYDLIMPLFGWVHRDTGLRRFRKGAVWVTKKQGKSTLAGGLVNAFLHLSGERAECYGFAHTAKQAAIVFRETAAFCRKSDFLRENSNINKSVNRITVPYLDSFYEAREGEAGSRASEGINPVLVIFDELHVQRSRELFDSLTYACAAQREALVLSISTVGVMDETSIWWEQYDYSRRIIAGTITDTSFFAYIAQADEACKENYELLYDPEQQKKANPSLDAPGCPTTEELNIAVREAINSPRKMNNLLRYRFGIPTAQIDRVVPMDAWRKCQLDDFPDLFGGLCYAGWDIASVEDLTALVLIFPSEEEGGIYYLKSYFWCPEEKIRDRERDGKAHYRDWVNKGFLKTLPGKRISYKQLLVDVRDILSRHKLGKLGYDKWNAEAAIQELELDYDVVEINQSLRGMTIGTKAFISAIEERRLRHDGNAVMTWCCENAAADKRSNEEYIKFDKDHSTGKIDGAVAAAMACHLAETSERPGLSIYDMEGGAIL